jgi:hypothetical protein
VRRQSISFKHSNLTSGYLKRRIFLEQLCHCYMVTLNFSPLGLSKLPFPHRLQWMKYELNFLMLFIRWTLSIITHTHQTNAQNVHTITNHSYTWTLLHVSTMSPWGWWFCSERNYVNEGLVIFYKPCTFVGVCVCVFLCVCLCVCVFVIMDVPFWWNDTKRGKSKQWGQICLRLSLW